MSQKILAQLTDVEVLAKFLKNTITEFSEYSIENIQQSICNQKVSLEAGISFNSNLLCDGTNFTGWINVEEHHMDDISVIAKGVEMLEKNEAECYEFYNIWICTNSDTRNMNLMFPAQQDEAKNFVISRYTTTKKVIHPENEAEKRIHNIIVYLNKGGNNI